VSQAIELPSAERVTLTGHSAAGAWRLEFCGIAPAVLAAAVDLLQGTRRSHAIVVTKHPTSATVEPIAVVDFYEKEDSDVQR
jgi:hypothetical protein